MALLKVDVDEGLVLGLGGEIILLVWVIKALLDAIMAT